MSIFFTLMPSNKFHWLELAEWATLGSSIVGVIGAVITKQFIMAGVPLTVALSLNIINQKRLQRQIGHERTAISKIHQDLQLLNQQVQVLPNQKVNTDNFNQSLFRLEETIQSLSEQFNNRIEQQDILRITNQLTKLEKGLSQDVLNITNQLSQIEEGLSQTVSNENFNQSLLRVRTQLEESIVQEIPKINQQLKEISSVHQYELVCNRDGSRNILLQALKQANERLILVCPWLSNYAIDDEIILMLKQLLNRNVYVDIGWGHLKDMQQEEFERGFFYNALPKIEELERMYPNKCKLKLLGTHEKFLVCDNKFAMIGSHNFLMSGTSSSEREIGIFTNDIHIISSLIERFDTATNLENQEPRGELEVQAPSLVAPPAIPALVAPPAIPAPAPPALTSTTFLSSILGMPFQDTTMTYSTSTASNTNLDQAELLTPLEFVAMLQNDPTRAHLVHQIPEIFFQQAKANCSTFIIEPSMVADRLLNIQVAEPMLEGESAVSIKLRFVARVDQHYNLIPLAKQGEADANANVPSAWLTGFRSTFIRLDSSSVAAGLLTDRDMKNLIKHAEFDKSVGREAFYQDPIRKVLFEMFLSGIQGAEGKFQFLCDLRVDPQSGEETIGIIIVNYWTPGAFEFNTVRLRRDRG
jgi:hypothetical protein